VFVQGPALALFAFIWTEASCARSTLFQQSRRKRRQRHAHAGPGGASLPILPGRAEAASVDGTSMRKPHGRGESSRVSALEVGNDR
jgi:hypothetical protein